MGDPCKKLKEGRGIQYFTGLWWGSASGKNRFAKKNSPNKYRLEEISTNQREWITFPGWRHEGKGAS